MPIIFRRKKGDSIWIFSSLRALLWDRIVYHWLPLYVKMFETTFTTVQLSTLLDIYFIMLKNTVCSARCSLAIISFKHIRETCSSIECYRYLHSCLLFELLTGKGCVFVCVSLSLQSIQCWSLLDITPCQNNKYYKDFRRPIASFFFRIEAIKYIMSWGLHRNIIITNCYWSEIQPTVTNCNCSGLIIFDNPTCFYIPSDTLPLHTLKKETASSSEMLLMFAILI